MSTKTIAQAILLILICAGAIAFVHVGTEVATRFGMESGFNGFLLGVFTHWYLNRHSNEGN